MLKIGDFSKIAGPCRENYLQSPGDTADPAQYVTEIQVPVERIDAN